jgi:DNA-directed RNA polymerase subunit M/transcription elongation factor TFIIS
MSEVERQPVFVRCGKCNERWKIATLPMSCKDFARAARSICPNCAEKKEIYMSGDDDVTQPQRNNTP